jgi:hypothetical protein
VDVSAALHLEAHGAGRPPRPRVGTRLATPVVKAVSRAEVPRSLAEPRRGRHPRHLVVKDSRVPTALTWKHWPFSSSPLRRSAPSTRKTAGSESAISRSHHPVQL